MSKPVCGVSSSLLAAQRQLESLREKRRAERVATGLPVKTDEHGRFLSPEIRNPYAVTGVLPMHLGWDSGAVTAVLRGRVTENRGAGGQGRKGAGVQGGRGENEPADIQTGNPTHSHTRPLAYLQTCRLYPDVALGMLRQELAAAGRIWLLLQHIDSRGRGWLTFEAAREKLTGKKSDLRVCGGRQLRNLLREGEGTFWRRENGRIWLRSVAKVAAALGIQRLTLQPVALPVTVLLEGIGRVRAHLYASFHSSRSKESAEAMPIARDTLARISHVPRRTQRFYEQRAKVKTKRNFAVGPAAGEVESETLAWQQGTAVFQLNDQAGWHGRKRRSYLVWQLPNNYTGPHTKQPRGRMKRINQELADLFMKGMTGNGEKSVEDKILPRRFFGNGRLAAKAFNQSANRDCYWKRTGPSPATPPTNYQLWYVLSNSKK